MRCSTSHAQHSGQRTSLNFCWLEHRLCTDDSTTHDPSVKGERSLATTSNNISFQVIEEGDGEGDKEA